MDERESDSYSDGLGIYSLHQHFELIWVHAGNGKISFSRNREQDAVVTEARYIRYTYHVINNVFYTCN